MGEARETILIVDDEPDLCRLLGFHLTDAGFRTETAATGALGLAKAVELRPNVVILDLMLPDIPGTEVCRRLRADPETSDVGILMLTARTDEYDRVVGFELGADDYVAKPYSPREVVLRVRALSRRIGERRAATGTADTGRRLRWRGLEMDPERHKVTAAGQELNLRPLEFKVLQLFLENPGKVLSRNDLLQGAWAIAGEGEGNPRTVDVHIRRLRERLGTFGEAVETVYGFGYRLREE